MDTASPSLVGTLPILQNTPSHLGSKGLSSVWLCLDLWLAQAVRPSVLWTRLKNIGFFLAHQRAVAVKTNP